MSFKMSIGLNNELDKAAQLSNDDVNKVELELGLATMISGSFLGIFIEPDKPFLHSTLVISAKGPNKAIIAITLKDETLRVMKKIELIAIDGLIFNKESIQASQPECTFAWEPQTSTFVLRSPKENWAFVAE